MHHNANEMLSMKSCPISCCGHQSTSLALLAAWFPCLVHETRYLLWARWGKKNKSERWQTGPLLRRFCSKNVCGLGFLLVKKSLSENFCSVQFNRVRLFVTSWMSQWIHLPVNTQDWFPLRWTGWISLQLCKPDKSNFWDSAAGVCVEFLSLRSEIHMVSHFLQFLKLRFNQGCNETTVSWLFKFEEHVCTNGGGLSGWRFFLVMCVSRSVMSDSLWAHDCSCQAPLSVGFSRQEY